MTEPGNATIDPIRVIAAEVTNVLERVDRPAVERSLELIMSAPRIFVVGEGRSGFMAKALAMRLLHLGQTVYVVGETCTPPVCSGDLLIAISGSGTSETPVRVAQKAGRQSATVLVLTTDPQSPLAELSDLLVHVPAATKHRRAGESPSVQPLSSLFDQSLLIVCDAIALQIAQRRQIDNNRAREAHANTE